MQEGRYQDRIFGPVGFGKALLETPRMATARVYSSASDEIAVASAMSSFTPGPIVDDTVMFLT